MDDISTWLFVILPFLATAIVLLAWLALILVQTPKPYWKDIFNWSLAGVILFAAIYFLTRAHARAGLPTFSEWQARIVLTAMGTFAIIGAPRTFRQLQVAIQNRKKGEVQ